jgi:hypothetical protein
MSIVRNIYLSFVSEETRFWLYKLRHFQEVESLKKKAFPSEKGTFSLRKFYENQCIFIHITKSAGTSLALSLFGELPYHYSAQQYRVIYGKKDFNDFYKFTFVRNPWDRLYSAYSYLASGGWDKGDKEWSEKNLMGIDSFEDFVLHWLTKEKLESHIHLRNQSSFICDSDNFPLIDFLGYFESIQSDFSQIMNNLQLPDRKLIHTNSSKRKSYTEVYTEKMIDKVGSLYHQDIENFGYSFESLVRTKVVNKMFIREI